MSSPRRAVFPLWALVSILAVGFLIWSHVTRARHLAHVNGIAEWSVDEPAPDVHSPTGYAGSQRRWIVPEHDNESYQWIAETQRMLAAGEWRLRETDADNAPFGREVHRPSLYRWWLAAMAWCDHAVSGRSLALAAEHAAQFADPALQLLWLIGATVMIAWRFNGWTAAIFSLGVASLFPFATHYLPGAPDHHGLAAICALESVLMLVTGFRALTATDGERHARRLFFAAGIAGGIGLWVSATNQGPILLGLIVGALGAACLLRRQTSLAVAPWRSWALGGAVTSLVAYMVEYFPAHMSLRLEVNHPLYAIAWLGAGELLARTTQRLQQGKSPWTLGASCSVALAVTAVAAVPIVAARGDGHGLLIDDPLATRLSYPNGVIAKNLGDWFARDGFSPPLIATLLPALLVVGAVIIVFRRKIPLWDRAALVVALGPVILAFGFASVELRRFQLFDATGLALLVLLSARFTRPEISRTQRWGWVAAVILVLIPGALLLMPPVGTAAREALAETEVESIVERDLAHWLAKRAGDQGAVVLASPDLTTTLNFHGGLRGIGTLDWENKAGLTAAVRIASATSSAEALALIQQRGVTHIVVPSWDSFLEAYARVGSSLSDRSLIAGLKRGKSLPWLRPVAYHLPQIGGFEGQAVAIFEVVDEQEESTMLSNQAEYFVEMGQLDEAEAVQKKLQRFPADLGALVTIARVAGVRGDAAGFGAVFSPILTAVANGGDRALSWERRSNLAAVLMQGKRADLAREQMRRCLAEANEARLRTLSSGGLFRLMALAGKLEVAFPDAHLREFALSLVPPASRSRL